MIKKMGLALAMIAASTSVQAKDVVVATVDGEKIMLSQLEKVKKNHPQLKAVALREVYKPLLESFINTKLLEKAANNSKIKETNEYKEALNEAVKNLTIKMYLEEQVKKLQTKEKLMAMYDQYKKDNPPKDEMQAAHILVKTEDQAKDLIAKLDKGADFGELADQYSENKGLPGGDLGFFSRELMVPEFSEAAFKLKEGEYSKVPVKTSFGWHIIKAGKHRLAEVPSFEEMENELMSASASQVVEDIVKNLSSKAKIVKNAVEFDKDGNIK